MKRSDLLMYAIASGTALVVLPKLVSSSGDNNNEVKERISSITTPLSSMGAKSSEYFSSVIERTTSVTKPMFYFDTLTGKVKQGADTLTGGMSSILTGGSSQQGAFGQPVDSGTGWFTNQVQKVTDDISGAGDVVGDQIGKSAKGIGGVAVSIPINVASGAFGGMWDAGTEIGKRVNSVITGDRDKGALPVAQTMRDGYDVVVDVGAKVNHTVQNAGVIAQEALGGLYNWLGTIRG